VRLRNGAYVSPHNQPNPKPSLCCALSGQEWHQPANSCVTACQNKHVCSAAQACGRVVEIAGMVNQRGDSIIANRVISGLVLKYLNGEYFVIRRGYKAALPVSR